MIINLMGVSGCGKTTVAELLSAQLSWPIFDADPFHSAENIARMSGAKPLEDQHRLPWLDAIGSHMQRINSQGGDGIYTCSALKAAYRSILRSHCPPLRFIYLKADKQTLANRMEGRRARHFMPPLLLESQIQTLEEPGPDEAIHLDAELPPESIAAAIQRALNEGII